MRREKSCGAVVFTYRNSRIEYLLAQNLSGTFGFPKGHVENSETEIQTALREVKEETALDVCLLDGFRMTETYALPRRKGAEKEVVYFLGRYENQTPRRQESELRSLALCPYEKALSLLRYDSAKNILTEANRFLTEKA